MQQLFHTSEEGDFVNVDISHPIDLETRLGLLVPNGSPTV